jgi:hypothetical protein
MEEIDNCDLCPRCGQKLYVGGLCMNCGHFESNE